ncbi:solute carrier family 35 member F4 isoform X2 [Oratosquilla oratoria]|uniref:solute carrier family 35 member F4 isoform X2 n=1 Tax=Oratosquilla oratoria TaxID=337810 RepID=UPI003F776CAB
MPTKSLGPMVDEPPESAVVGVSGEGRADSRGEGSIGSGGGGGGGTGGHRRPSIATIFNPRKTRSGVGDATSQQRPSVVITDEDSSPKGRHHHLMHLTNGGTTPTVRATSPSVNATPSGSPSIHMSSPLPRDPEIGSVAESTKDNPPSKCERFKNTVFSKTTRKIVAGVVVTCCVTTSWVGATHLIKDMFLMQTSVTSTPALPQPTHANITSPTVVVASSSFATLPLSSVSGSSSIVMADDVRTEVVVKVPVFDAPFLTTWFCTVWTGLFFPLYLVCHSCLLREKTSIKASLKNIGQNFRDRGVTLSKFVTRCCLFCLLWVATNYMYIHSLRILDCTDVMALYSAHVSFVYLLSWVILHDQFVGVRIVAVILCNTGIALLAYMDGITRTKTLGGVVLAAAAAAGSAVYKVLFKKVIGDASLGQVSLFFTVMALLNTLLLSPLVAVLYLTGIETVIWSELPWVNLLTAAALSLAANLLGNFGLAVTFEIFITLGLVLAVPVSAALDIRWYGVVFEGMKLAGVVLIVTGFFLVLFPANWPEYITKLLRCISCTILYGIIKVHNMVMTITGFSSRWGRNRKRNQSQQPPEPIDYRTGLISRSHLRSPSGLIR